MTQHTLSATMQGDSPQASPDLVGEEVIRHLWWSGHLTGALQTEDQQVQHQPVVLDNEGGKLEPADHSIRVGVVHVLEVGRWHGCVHTYVRTYVRTYRFSSTIHGNAM